MSETMHDGTVAVTAAASPDAGLTAAELAAKYGLSVSGARPSLVEYVRQLWGRRHFILAFSQAKLTAQYSQAKLGQLWQVATPLLNAAVYFFIFGLILHASRGMSQDVYIPFLVTGVFVFTFTQSSVMSGVRAISGNLGLVRALHFPRASLPISFSLQQLQQLLFSMLVLFAVSIGFGSYPGLSWLLIVPVLVLQFLFNTGLALIVARMGAKTPDLAQLMPFLLRTWMYASGVMFSINN
ncbi:ABC transporter permease, partial [Streptomyces eurythermus]